MQAAPRGPPCSGTSTYAQHPSFEAETTVGVVQNKVVQKMVVRNTCANPPRIFQNNNVTNRSWNFTCAAVRAVLLAVYFVYICNCVVPLSCREQQELWAQSSLKRGISTYAQT